MNTEEKAELADLENAWHNHPITLKRRADMEERRINALAGILSAAATSTDPAVRAAIAKYREVDGIVISLGGRRYWDGVK